MTFQVSRSGQTYGPYTLDDLRRYLASGNVLANDLAKSEEMTEWLPVSSILAGDTASAASPFQSYNDAAQPVGQNTGQTAGHTGSQTGFSGSYTAPYGGFASPVDAAALNRYPDPPNLSWIVYAILTVICFFVFFLFSKIFTVVQAAWLRKVQPDSKALYWYIALYVLAVINFVMGFALLAQMLAHPGVLPTGGGVVRGFLGLIYIIGIFVTRFIFSGELEKHFNTVEPIGLKMNGAAVFFLGGIYFQYKFNEINQLKTASRSGQRSPY